MSPLARATVVLSVATSLAAQGWERVPRLFNPLGVELRAVADLDLDGFPDLVQFNGTSEQGVWPAVTGLANLGTCAFTPGVTQGLPTGTSRAIAVADFDGDLQPDLVGTTNGGYAGGPGLLFHRGLAGGLFASPVFLPLPRYVEAMVTGDANGDNLADVAVFTYFGAGTGPELRWVVGVPAQTPAVLPAFTVPTSSPPYSMTRFDRDGDGDDDLAVTIGTTLHLFDPVTRTPLP